MSSPHARLISLRSKHAAMAALAALMLSVSIVSPALAQTYKVLYSFTGSDGQWPYPGVVRDKKGNLYGVGHAGGEFGQGVVFKVDNKGNETVLYSFTGGIDGGTPDGGVAVDGSGNVYGTTYVGGTVGAGVVFKVSSGGKETVLHNFAGGTSDGCQPWVDLRRDKSGNLYGTTTTCGVFGYGVVWKIDTRGAETVLHSFAGGTSDGAYPWYDGVVKDATGNLYGVTDQGGTQNAGVVYQLSSGGKLTVLYSFTGVPPDIGEHPFGTPALDNSGNLYGTTYTAGTNCWGTVWKVSKNGGGEFPYCFAGWPSDGGSPRTGVTRDAAGNLYGVTEQGGSLGYGAVFKIDTKGNETVIHNFAGGGTDGSNPEGRLILDAKGNIYGTTALGGTNDLGIVWKLTP